MQDILTTPRPADWGAPWLRSVAATLESTGILAGAALSRYQRCMPETARRNDLSEATLTALICDPELGEVWFRLLSAAPAPDTRVSGRDREFDCAAERTLSDAFYYFARSADVPKFSVPALSRHIDRGISQAIAENATVPWSWWWFLFDGGPAPYPHVLLAVCSRLDESQRQSLLWVIRHYEESNSADTTLGTRCRTSQSRRALTVLSRRGYLNAARILSDARSELRAFAAHPRHHWRRIVAARHAAIDLSR